MLVALFPQGKGLGGAGFALQLWRYRYQSVPYGHGCIISLILMAPQRVP